MLIIERVVGLVNLLYVFVQIKNRMLLQITKTLYAVNTVIKGNKAINSVQDFLLILRCHLRDIPGKFFSFWLPSKTLNVFFSALLYALPSHSP
jgi:hypothetical protein